MIEDEAAFPFVVTVILQPGRQRMATGVTDEVSRGAVFDKGATHETILETGRPPRRCGRRNDANTRSPSLGKP